jgi:hypothetical protein
MIRHVAWKKITDVSEVLTATIDRAMSILKDSYIYTRSSDFLNPPCITLN